jgi:ABC-2 type transport system permease protein
MNGATFRLELRRNRSLFFWLAVVGVVYGGFISGFFPVLRQNLAALEEYLAIMPEAMLIAFGMEGGSLAQPGGFFATYIGTWLWPILAAIAGILAGTRPTAADLDRGFLELPLATPISRVRYLATAIVGQLVLMFVLAATLVGAVLVAGWVVGAGFDAARFALVIPLAAAFGWAIAGVATLMGVLTLSRGIAAGVTVGLLLFMYLADIVGRIEPDLEWLSWMTAFRYFDTRTVIETGVFPFGDFAIFVVVAVAAWTLAVVAFQRRDLAA